MCEAVSASNCFHTIQMFENILHTCYDYVWHLYCIQNSSGLAHCISAYRKQRHITKCSSNISKRTKSIFFSVNILWTLSLSTFVFSIENKSMHIDSKAMGAVYTSLIAYTFTQHMKLDSWANSCAFLIIVCMLAAARNNHSYSEANICKSLFPTHTYSYSIP